MPPHQGKFGIRDFTQPTTATNPKQPCDLPHEGDPFCGNDNNRRAVLAKMREEAKANPDAFDAQAAVVLLGGEERIKKAIAGIPQFRDMSDEPATAPVDDDDVIDYAKAALFLGSRGYKVTSPEEADTFIEKLSKEERVSFVLDLASFVPTKEKADGDDDPKGSTDGAKGSQDAPPTDPKGDEAKGEQKTTVKPPKPPAGTAPAWKPNA
jgi:hypothetical protein